MILQNDQNVLIQFVSNIFYQLEFCFCGWAQWLWCELHMIGLSIIVLISTLGEVKYMYSAEKDEVRWGNGLHYE